MRGCFMRRTQTTISTRRWPHPCWQSTPPTTRLPVGCLDDETWTLLLPPLCPFTQLFCVKEEDWPPCFMTASRGVTRVPPPVFPPGLAFPFNGEVEAAEAKSLSYRCHFLGVYQESARSSSLW